MTTETTFAALAAPRQRVRLVLPVLSVALSVLPVLVNLAYFGSSELGVSYDSDLYNFLLLAWTAIPLVWVAAVGVGIATLVQRELGRWRIAGGVAVALPVIEVAVVFIAMTTMLASLGS
jgi:hypothetical protein